MKDKGKVSIIIVNWNGKKWLKPCLDSLRLQTYKNFEIIFVDNASSDDSVEYVRSNYPEVIIVKNDKNSGFAGGNNLGFKYSSGEFVLLLNNDTRATPDFLEKLISSFQEIPNLGSVQSKILLLDREGALDVCGSYWSDSSFLYHYGYGKNEKSSKYNRSMPFFSNKGASMLIRRSIIEELGLFDEDFWCYYEETDFCNRLWLSGYECWYYPDAVVYHAMGGTALRFDSSFIQFHNFKNKLLSFLKNFEKKTLIKAIPIFIFGVLFLGVVWIITGKWGNVSALLRAIFWNITHLPKTLHKRRKIQEKRKKTDKEIFRRVKKNPKLSYYYFLLTDLAKYDDL